MFNRTEGRGSVLGICVTPESFVGQSAALDYRAVHSARRAMDMLRLVRFDLILVNVKLPDISVWNLMRHIKTANPQQKWALVGGPLSEQQEIAARMLDVTTVFEVAPAIEAVCNWRTFSDVIRSAKCVAPRKAAVEVEKSSEKQLCEYSKQTSTFEITRTNRAPIRRASYARNSALATV
jgi:CheY-like chemotaxis protein